MKSENTYLFACVPAALFALSSGLVFDLRINGFNRNNRIFRLIQPSSHRFPVSNRVPTNGR
jgi:hypothetical protein